MLARLLGTGTSRLNQPKNTRSGYAAKDAKEQVRKRVRHSKIEMTSQQRIRAEFEKLPDHCGERGHCNCERASNRSRRNTQHRTELLQAHVEEKRDGHAAGEVCGHVQPREPNICMEHFCSSGPKD